MEKSKKIMKSIIPHLEDPVVKNAVKVKARVIAYATEFLREQGFIELLPTIVSPLTDPLNHEVFNVRFNYYGTVYQLTQSMIFHKQLAVTAFERIFIVSPNIRLETEEKKDSGRHLFEFTQMDFEVAYASMFDIMNLVEDLLIHILWKVNHLNREDLESLNRDLRMPRKPFDIYTSHELIETYGEDWEDKASQDHREPFWVICHKREFYDKEDEI